MEENDRTLPAGPAAQSAMPEPDAPSAADERQIASDSVITEDPDAPVTVDEPASDNQSDPEAPASDDEPADTDPVAISTPVITEDPDAPVTVDEPATNADTDTAATSAPVITEDPDAPVTVDEPPTDADTVPADTSAPTITEDPDAPVTVDEPPTNADTVPANTSAPVITEDPDAPVTVDEPATDATPADPAVPTPQDETLLPEQLLMGTEAPAEKSESDHAHLLALLEAVVYVTDEPLTLEQIAKALGEPQPVVQTLLDQLVEEFNKPIHGLTVREVAGGFKMATKPEHHEAVRTFVKNLNPPLKLSLAALETLAVIAYKQPITAPEIMEIRGVQGAGVLKTLIDRKLITTAGRKNVVGKPILYKTTREFLVQFGLRDLNELPTLKEFEDLRRMAFSEDGSPVVDSVGPEQDNNDEGGAADTTPEKEEPAPE